MNNQNCNPSSFWRAGCWRLSFTLVEDARIVSAGTRAELHEGLDVTCEILGDTSSSHRVCN